MRIRFRYILPGLILTALVSSSLTLMWTRSQYEDLSKLKSVYNMLDKDYVTPVEKDTLLNGAVNGMMEALDDPYSVYMTSEESQSFEENIINSSFVGIGAEIAEQDGKIVIVSPIKGAPAEKAGLKPNDRILKVGETSLEGMSSSDAVKLLRGEKGTEADLTVERPGETELLRVAIVRDTIPIETVYAEMKDDGIGVIQITQVSESTAQEFARHLLELKNQGLKGLVLDLRQNPGGLLNVSFEIAEMLVPEDKVVLQVESRDGTKEVYRSRGSGDLPNTSDIPVVGLIDGGTASAGEILAGALQESAGVKLVGVKTFGKGTAQTLINLKDGSTIKYTNAKWLTPEGNWIHKTGIEPDVEVKLPDYAGLTYVNPDNEWSLDSYSTDVKSIQIILEALGYAPGRTDGYFSQGTKAAIASFQQAEGLEADGVAGGAATRRLMELIAEKIRTDDTQLEAAIRLLSPAQ